MGKRLLKVNEALREALSREIGAGLKDPRVGFVTVTGVQTSPDLRHARVYVSVLGGKRDRERTLAGLKSSHGYLQERIATTVRLKRTPQLDFFYDESVDRGLRMEKLLKRYEGELGDESGDGATLDDEAGGGEGEVDETAEAQR